MGGFQWFGVVCGGLWWFAVVCGNSMVPTHVALQSLYIREKRYYCVRISCDENTNHSQYSCEIESDLRRSHDNNCETLVFN